LKKRKKNMKCWWGWCKSREKKDYEIMGDDFEKNKGCVICEKVGDVRDYIDIRK
jgi:hypothetical protein